MLYFCTTPRNSVDSWQSD